jgi:hypothetical protein
MMGVGDTNRCVWGWKCRNVQRGVRQDEESLCELHDESLLSVRLVFVTWVDVLRLVIPL